MLLPQREQSRIAPRRDRGAFRLSDRRAQHRIDKRIRPPLAVFFREFYGSVAGGGCGYFIHEEDLIDAEAQNFTDLRLYARFSVAQILGDHIVERVARLDRAVNEFRQKAAVAVGELRRAHRTDERDVRIRAVPMHLHEYLHRKLPHGIDLVCGIAVFCHSAFPFISP